MPISAAYVCRSRKPRGVKLWRRRSMNRSSLSERPIFMMLSSSSRSMRPGVRPVMHRRNRTHTSSVDTCMSATLCVSPLWNEGRVSVSMPTMVPAPRR